MDILQRILESMPGGAEMALLISFLTPVIVGLVEVAKQVFTMPKNFVPLIAVAVGLIAGFVAAPFVELDWTLRLWAGAIAGLASTGLYETQTKREGQTRS